jgi:hypothetical protein
MSGPSVADAIVAIGGRAFDLVHDAAGVGWALEGSDALRIGSETFGERLAYELYGSTGRAAAQAALAQATNLLRAMAVWDGPEIEVGLRIAPCDGRVVVDLADAEERVAVIGPDGWAVTTESPLPFHRPAGMLPLPLPMTGGDLDDLADLWPVRGDELILVRGWVLGCFNPSGVKPILDLSGMQGSGKSVLARMLLALVDPHANQLATLPKDDRGLAVVAARRGVVGFDNVSIIPEELSDPLCRLVTPGAGFETRKLYTDDDVVAFSGTRPVLLTGIPEVAKQPDLVDRTIAVTLPRMTAGERRREAEVLATFEALLPALLGRLFDAVSCALANVATTALPDVPRMADFATWVEAGAPALGWEPGRFLDAYLANRRDASGGLVEGTFIGRFVPELAEHGFTGTATECLARLEIIAGPDAPRRHGWPATANGLSNILRRLVEPFAAAGILIEFDRVGHDRKRIIRIHRAETPIGAVLPFERPPMDRLTADAAAALRNVGVGATWPITKAAALALKKAGGNASAAAAALNDLGIPGPIWGPWTAEAIRGAV